MDGNLRRSFLAAAVGFCSAETQVVFEELLLQSLRRVRNFSTLISGTIPLLVIDSKALPARLTDVARAQADFLLQLFKGFRASRIVRQVSDILP